jgi:glycosyltransferase involved in cell wall biosynthesis
LVRHDIRNSGKKLALGSIIHRYKLTGGCKLLHPNRPAPSGRATVAILQPGETTSPPGSPGLPHVLHIASGDLWAGAEAQLCTLARSLAGMQVPVTVALLNHGILEQRLLAAGIPVFIFDEELCTTLQIVSGLARLIRKRNIDVVHTHRIKENILGSAAAFFAGNTPSMRTVHGVPEQDPGRWQLAKRLVHFTNRVSGRLLQKRVISVSEELAAILARDYPIERIAIIRNGVDTDPCNPVPKYTTSDNDGTSFIVGFAGRLVAIKRVDLLIRTARLVLDHFPALDARFVIYGDGPLRSELEELSRTLETGRIVRFEGHWDDIRQALERTDALLMTSDNEGLPMILLEAMVAGVPVIAHAVGAIPELLCQGECGMLVQDHTPEGYANAIFLLACDTDLRRRVTAAARERVTALYTAQQNAHRYLETYQEICRFRPAAGARVK